MSQGGRDKLQRDVALHFEVSTGKIMKILTKCLQLLQIIWLIYFKRRRLPSPASEGDRPSIDNSRVAPQSCPRGQVGVYLSISDDQS